MLPRSWLLLVQYACAGSAEEEACSLNGAFDRATGLCECDHGWHGKDCGKLRLAESYPVALDRRWSWGGAVVRLNERWHAYLRSGPFGNSSEPCAKSPDQGATGEVKSPAGIAHLTSSSLFGPYLQEEDAVAVGSHIDSVTATSLPSADTPVLMWAEKGIQFMHLTINGTNESQGHLQFAEGSSLPANPSIVASRDGERLFLCGRHGGSKANHSGWNITLERILMSVSTKGTNLSSTTFTQGTTVLSNLAAEDPFCWANSRGYHMLLHMFDCNSLYMHVGLHAWSVDGIQWNASKTPAYNGSVVFADNNQTVNFSRRERPFLVFAKDRPLALVNSAQRNFFWVSGWINCSVSTG